MDDFEKELKLGFLEEAAQLLNNAEQRFLALESASADPAILEEIFRLAHNLKGSGNAVGFMELGHFTHELESYLLKLKDGTLKIDGDAVTLLLKCNDHIVTMVNGLKENLAATFDSTRLLGELAERLNPIQDDPMHRLMEVEVRKSLDETAQVATITPIHSAVPPKQKKAAQTGDDSVRVRLDRLEKLLNYVGEVVILQTVLKEQAYGSDQALLRKTIHQMSKVTKEVQDLSMSLRMVPIKQTFQKMQRIVRDTSSTLKKEVQLILEGEETEVDKTVLESISDPLVHLIRNAVDHGIESADSRMSQGKSAMGTIHLKAFHQSGCLLLEIRDDGAGLDPDKLTAKAIEKGILPAGTKLAPQEAFQLIFHSGFSTKAVTTDVSGRGVGMDVVKTNIESLQGEIKITTELGKGTCFQVQLPLTLAIIDAMIVACGTERYVIPLPQVHESLRPKVNNVHGVTGLGEVLCLRGENLPLYRLSGLLGRKTQLQKAEEATAIVFRPHTHPFAVLVDDIIGQHEVVIKRIGAEHRDVSGFSGSAILGDGKPALILEMAEMIRQFNSKAQRVAV